MKGVGRLTILNGYFGYSFNEEEEVIMLTLKITLFSLRLRKEKIASVLAKQGVKLLKTDTVNS